VAAEKLTVIDGGAGARPPCAARHKQAATPTGPISAQYGDYALNQELCIPPEYQFTFASDQ